MKKLLCLLAVLSVSAIALAQTHKTPKQIRKEDKRKRIDALIKQEEEGVIAYHKQTVYGVKLNTDGYGAFLEIGRSKTVQKGLLFQFEINERKHNKETKQRGANFFSAPFMYGKLNFFYPVKMGVQYQLLLGNKSNKNGVSVSGNLGGGLSLGFLRPYKIEVDKAGTRTKVWYNDADSLLFRNSFNDQSASGPGLGSGWKNLKLTPGLYIKPAVRFDYGKMNELVSALEVGVNLELYAKKIPQMLDLKQNQLFLSAFVALQFGKRK